MMETPIVEPAAVHSTTAVLARWIAAPPSAVFAAVTQPGRLQQWLGPADFKATSVTADLRIGGVFKFRMRRADGLEFGAEGIYREILAGARVVLSWRWNEPPPGHLLDRSHTVLSFDVEPQEEGTLLTLTHERLADNGSAADHHEVWRQAVDKLERKFSTAAGPEAAAVMNSQSR